jgi:DNA-binding NarL/FixJ family response regulator
MKRILLVDDHNLFRQALSIILERHMDLEENVQARSPAEARQAFSDLEGNVDLAVIDLNLPGGTAVRPSLASAPR